MQRLTIVRYKVKPDAVLENEALSHAAFDRLRRDAPKHVSYNLFREADGQSFVHLFVNVEEDSSDVLTETSEFQAFTAEISNRCESPPQVTRLSVDRIDSYGALAA